MRPIEAILEDLRLGRTTSHALAEACLANIADPAGEGARTFTRVDPAAVLAAAGAADDRRKQGDTAPRRGLPVSVKDLFDVAGEVTTAGSTVLRDATPATADAPVITRLKAAGAVIVGRTNMTEFAYSGLGLNPHYGTPANPWDRANRRIPGGSSSGAAISVTDAMAAVGVGSDTGGSVRIPAALCGLTGFKPTQRRVPTEGVLPLSTSLDSIGPLAPTVDCCARVDAVMAGEVYRPIVVPSLSSLRVAVLQGYVLDGLDAEVGGAWERALLLLEAAGLKLESATLPCLDLVPASNQTAAPEAYARHRDLLERESQRYDPHVSARILHGAGMLAADYIGLMRTRREVIAAAATALDGFDAVLMPTTPCIAPRIADLEASDDAYFQANGAVLRNPSIFNYLDGCGLSIPCHREGEPPMGLMIAGMGGWDAAVLRTGAAMEQVLRPLQAKRLEATPASGRG